MYVCSKITNGSCSGRPRAFGLSKCSLNLPIRRHCMGEGDRPSHRRPTAISTALKQQRDLQAAQQQAGKSEKGKAPRTTTVLAISSLAALLLVCPGQVVAEQLPEDPTAQDSQALSILLPAGNLAANLAAPEAPALVSNSGEVLLQGVKGMVESGLQDLAANSMTAVGGPVTGDVLSASASQGSADIATTETDQTAMQQQQQPAQSGGNMAPLGAATLLEPQQQRQQQQQEEEMQPRRHLPGGWCSAAWQAYCDALERSPLPTKVYTGVVGTLLGDLAAQVLSHTSKQQRQQGGNAMQSSSSSSSHVFQFDSLRAGRLCLYSAAVGTPMGHYWYALLESAVLPATPLAPAAVAAKVLLDQLVQTPFGMALFFAAMKALEGKPQEVQQELQSKMVPALLANYKLWPAAQLINFTLIPEEQRILYGNIIGICWTCVISNMQQASAPTDAPNSRRLGTSAAATGGRASSIAGMVGPAANTPVGYQEGSHDATPAFRLRRRSSTSVAA